jgi:hypothetical protein
MEREFVVETVQTLTEKRVADLLVGAFEGGSNYWIDSVEVVDRGGHAPAEFKKEYPRLVVAAIYGALKFKPSEDDRAYALDRKKLTAGLALLAKRYPKRFASIVAEEDDAEDSDVLLQLALFGELVYG